MQKNYYSGVENAQVINSDSQKLCMLSQYNKTIKNCNCHMICQVKAKIGLNHIHVAVVVDNIQLILEYASETHGTM